MTQRHIARKLPYRMPVVEGQTYQWCACGLSKAQPFCDGSHQGTGHEPVAYVAEETGWAFFCGCKATRHEPLCDGSHGTV